jgi:pyruvate/2-oxoglutarate dehydrogenase complex dihydrolipoamide acyltransferase (E2) component
VLERRLDKTVLRAPADGIVSVIVAEVGENIHAGQPVLVIEVTGKQWLSFNAREVARITNFFDGDAKLVAAARVKRFQLLRLLDDLARAARARRPRNRKQATMSGLRDVNHSPPASQSAHSSKAR